MYRSLESAAKDVFTEGLAVTGGLIGSSGVGLAVESYVNKTPVTVDSTFIAKATAAVSNNLPKLLIYSVLDKISKGDTVRNAKHGILASVAFDSVLRATNKGVNPLNVSIGGYRILDQNVNQKIIQENSLLRTELNKALQKLSNPDSSRDFRYGGAPNPAVEARQRAYGFAATPDQLERQRKYGAMPFEQSPEKTSRERKYGFMSYKDEPASVTMFGMQ